MNNTIGFTGQGISRSRHPTILVIEDESALSELMRDELVSFGYKVILAVDGAEGLEKIQDTEPDLVICDRSMPRMTGAELLARLRGHYPQYGSVPFIFLTAMTSAGDKADVQGLGPFAYMEKPLNFDLLHKTILRALRGD